MAGQNTGYALVEKLYNNKQQRGMKVTGGSTQTRTGGVSDVRCCTADLTDNGFLFC